MLINIFCFVIGLIGVALTSYGAWLIYHPLGLLLCGFYCLLWSFLMSKNLSNYVEKETQGDS